LSIYGQKEHIGVGDGHIRIGDGHIHIGDGHIHIGDGYIVTILGALRLYTCKRVEFMAPERLLVESFDFMKTFMSMSSYTYILN